MKSIKTLFLAIALLLVFACDKNDGSAIAAEPAATVDAPAAPKNFIEGKDYKLLATTMPTRDPNKVEVIEFFWYGCPHCYDFEPKLQAWALKLPAYVDFWRSPVVWGAAKKAHAQVYYTAEALGVVDKVHKPFFEVMHEATREKKTENVYVEQADIRAFFKAQGVAEDKFDQAFSSFTVMSKVTMADARGRSYMIQGVPTLIVNGKYLVQGSMPHALAVVDYLITRERK